ncbi:MAG: hypothetical protein ACD_68C00074G0003 [uncultured bacterium]|nr:MAG: hypothetical protein ACD_68C00074G0003 [uncultured bacterium]
MYDILQNLREMPERFLEKSNIFAVYAVDDDDPSAEGKNAYQIIKKSGYRTFALGRGKGKIDNEPIYDSLAKLPQKPTVMYIATADENLRKFIEECVAAEINLVWFRPSTENSELMDFCLNHSIEILTHRDLARTLTNERAYC